MMPDFQITVRPGAYAAFVLFWLAAGIVFDWILNASLMEPLKAAIGIAVLASSMGEKE
jgi:hypothetical protein